MKAPFFTVLIDTYNYGKYIEEAVSSALAQEFPAEEREILLVDDGSTDDTQERLGKFGEAIRYLRKPNGGQASAFNFGFEHARRSDRAAGCGRRLASGKIKASA
jgi:glycosyltransferase involved in cell wall biosynthesis